jgi:hypothetical protein
MLLSAAININGHYINRNNATIEQEMAQDKEKFSEPLEGF